MPSVGTQLFLSPCLPLTFLKKPRVVTKVVHWDNPTRHRGHDHDGHDNGSC